MSTGRLVLWILLYLAAARASLAWGGPRWRLVLFALVNVFGVWRLAYPASFFENPIRLAIFGVYLALVAFQYFMLDRFAERPGSWPWLAFFTPLTALFLIKYLPPLLDPLWRALGHPPANIESYYFIGISYLAFRSSHLVLEIRNGIVKKPGFWEYLSFCFFLPTLSMGPISTYAYFSRGFAGPDRAELPLGRSFLRVLVGWTKFMFLAHPCNQLAYQNFILDDHPHRWPDLVIAAVAYYLFLYFNFSGFCDVAIGAGGLLGFPIEENFNQPFLARNIQDYWNRWHITLSRYLRDVAFAPLCKWLVGILGLAATNTAIAISIFTIFILIGIWHGVGWHFVAFGAAHGAAVVVIHYYAIGLKKWLGRDGYKRYLQNVWIRAAAIAVTFAYVTAALFLFANDFPTMRKIISAVSF